VVAPYYFFSAGFGARGRQPRRATPGVRPPEYKERGALIESVEATTDARQVQQFRRYLGRSGCKESTGVVYECNSIAAIVKQVPGSYPYMLAYISYIFITRLMYVDLTRLYLASSSP
jgi:hypothetical protein